jgi:hypothetical protein
MLLSANAFQAMGVRECFSANAFQVMGVRECFLCVLQAMVGECFAAQRVLVSAASDGCLRTLSPRTLFVGAASYGCL